MTEAIYLEVTEKAEAAHKAKRRVSVSGMLKILGVSRSGYRAWLKHVPSNAEKRRESVKAKIKDIYDKSKQNYGAPKITQVLRKTGETISERTVIWKFTMRGLWNRMSRYNGYLQNVVKPCTQPLCELAQFSWIMETLNCSVMSRCLADRATEYVIEPTKTNAGTRVIPMTKEVTEMFRAIIQDRPEYKVEKVVGGYTGFLFLDKNGMPLVAMHWEHRFNSMVGRYNEIYKVQMPNITPHVCRHTYCSNMAKSGMNPKTLQYLMGHSDIAVTLNVYTHVGLEDAEKELQRMQGLENARKEMGISDMDDKPLKQNMFKVV